MALRSALAGAATTVGVIAALGNPLVVEAVVENEPSALTSTLVRVANWDVFGRDPEIVVQTVLRLGALLVAVTLLCALVGRSASRGASLLAGWAALTLAAGLAGLVNYVYSVEAIFDGRTFAPSYFDGLVTEVNGAAAFGLWVGWTVGVVLAIVTPAGAQTPAHGVVPGHGPALGPDRTYREPPPPWWAPAQVDAHGTVVEPGPSVFPPGGLPHAPAPAPPAPVPPAAQPGAQEMTTVSGDPHPSDPDATQAVGLPPRADDPEATTTMESANPDPTLPTPRHD